MELLGERLIPASVDATWLALNDLDVLKACIPGCEQLTQGDPSQFEVVMALKIGPIGARFKGNLTMTNVVSPTSYTINFEGQGGVAGFGKGSADVKLSSEDAGTRLNYVARAQVGGKIAQVGSRLIDAAAGKIAQSFFKRFEATLDASVG
jgi:carbon monoxide dehydrogenase subunit G